MQNHGYRVNGDYGGSMDIDRGPTLKLKMYFPGCGRVVPLTPMLLKGHLKLYQFRT